MSKHLCIKKVSYLKVASEDICRQVLSFIK
jgi:hypothetical protein